MPSPRPMPREQKIASGGFRSTRENKHVPAKVPGTPQPPEGMGGYALEMWHEYAALLKKRGQLSQDSRASFIALCSCWQEWRELQDDLRMNGRYQRVVTGSGDVMERTRPALQAYQHADNRLRAWLIEFGLTDSSRGSVSLTPEEAATNGATEQDPLAEFGLH